MLDTIVYYLIALAIVICGFCYIVGKVIDLKKKAATIQATTGLKKNGGMPSLVDGLDQLPFVLEQTKAIYNQQYDECIAQKLPKEQAEKILKPLADKIKMMETLTHPVYGTAIKVGASIADKGIKAVGKALDGIA